MVPIGKIAENKGGHSLPNRPSEGDIMEIKFYKCEHCGNIAIKVVDSGVPMICCGEPMVELVAGATDGEIGRASCRERV